ncbi:hypothetical protein C0J52_11563 [Blattella germanica]|nr:hypothetical protein C0J52_11563 [Blattella germanica]
MKVFHDKETDCAFKIILYISKIVGLIPFTWESSDTNFEFRTSFIGLIWASFLFATFLYNLISIMVHDFAAYNDTTLQVVGVLVKLPFFICYPVSTLSIWLHRDKINAFLKNLLICDQTLNVKTPHILIYIIIQIISSLILLILSTVLFVYNDGNVRIIIYIPIMISISIVQLHFVNCVHLIRQYFQFLNLSLENVSCFRGKIYSQVIEFAMSVHNTLCEIIELGNAIYSYALLQNTLLLFFNATFNLYFMLFHRKVNFTACGFFRLDYTLLYSISGALTTYLVILIQFHQSFEVRDPCGNVTCVCPND